MSDVNVTVANKVESYAVFVDGIFSNMYYYPSDGNDRVIAMTAALQSNPSIVFTGNNGNNTNIYSVFVEEENAGQIFLPISVEPIRQGYIDSRNYSFQNNPTIIWIESDNLIDIDSKYFYDGTTLTLLGT